MRILVIHTGGTIGMLATSQGFAPASGVVEDAIATLQRQDDLDAKVDMQTLTPLIDSGEATPQDWQRLASAIFGAQSQYGGVVVTHGTDTLAYTAAALCMALPGLQKPVIVTGSMTPLTVENSDGWRNLSDAIRAAQTEAAGVWVQFGGRLLHGGRVRKSHSAALDAFEADTAETTPVIPAPALRLNAVQQHNVGVFTITPGPSIDMLNYAAHHCDGLVLRCYGAGTAPDTPGLRAALQSAFERQVPIVAVSQCAEGGIRLGTYAAGQVMRDTGVVDGRDMTPEMAYVKMQYVLSMGVRFAEQRSVLGRSLCGEITTQPRD